LIRAVLRRINSEMPAQSQQDLLRLRRAVLTMCAGAESRVAQSFEALLDRKLSVAREVRSGDDEMDKMETDIESECLRILALDAPVASDLRFVLSAMRINSSLERIADMARAVAKKAIKLENLPHVDFPPSLKEMADLVLAMVRDACKALAADDLKLATEVRRRDSQVDQKNKEFFAWVVSSLSQNSSNAEAIIHMLIVGRTIERIGDVAVTIAEDVIFAVGGEIVRHTPV